MGLQRWFYAGGRPKRVARLLDRATAEVCARGVGPEYLVALEVPGRRSGRIVSMPLVVADFHARREYKLGAEREGGGRRGRLASWASRGGAPARSGRAGSASACAEGLLEAGVERQRARADRRGRAARGVRAVGATLPRVPDRAEKQHVSPRQASAPRGSNFGRTRVSPPRLQPAAKGVTCPQNLPRFPERGGRRVVEASPLSPLAASRTSTGAYGS